MKATVLKASKVLHSNDENKVFVLYSIIEKKTTTTTTTHANGTDVTNNQQKLFNSKKGKKSDRSLQNVPLK